MSTNLACLSSGWPGSAASVQDRTGPAPLPFHQPLRLSAGEAVKPDWDAFKQQVKAASDIVAVVGSYVNLRPAGQTFKGLCPFHDDKHPSFDVDPRRQRYRCWACNKFGDVINFVQELERVSFPEALELLARRAGISLEKLARGRRAPAAPLCLT